MVNEIVPIFRDIDTQLDAWETASDFVMKSLPKNPQHPHR